MLTNAFKFRYRHKKLILSLKLVAQLCLITKIHTLSFVRKLFLKSKHSPLQTAMALSTLQQKRIMSSLRRRKFHQYLVWNHLPFDAKSFSFRGSLSTKSRRRCLFSGVARGLRFGVGRLFLIRSASRGQDFSLGLSRW